MAPKRHGPRPRRLRLITGLGRAAAWFSGRNPRDYSKKVPKSVKRLALRKALSSRIDAGDVLIAEEIQGGKPEDKGIRRFSEVADRSTQGSGDLHAI